MTEIAKIYLGNIQNNINLSQRLTTETYLKVLLQPSDRSKGRIHVHSDSGVAIGIIKSRDRFLQTGDLFQTESGKLLLIHVQHQEILVCDFTAIDPDVLPVQLVYFGHVLGNHHYPMAIKNNKIYVQLITDKSVIEQIIDNLNIPGLQISYEQLSADEETAFVSHSH